MSVTEDSGSDEACTRCSGTALSMCVECNDMVCSNHIDLTGRSSPWGFKSRIGTELVICQPCGRKRFWRYIRGAGVIVLLAAAFVLWMERLPTVAMVLFGVLVAWWIMATRMTHAADLDLHRERDPSSPAADSSEG